MCLLIGTQPVCYILLQVQEIQVDFLDMVVSFREESADGRDEIFLIVEPVYPEYMFPWKDPGPYRVEKGVGTA